MTTTSKTEQWGEQCRLALAQAALADIPKILTQMDRDPVSRTYGCFDRDYWHYRVNDFPCGMSQEFVLPLALVWALDLPANPYRGQPQIRAWVEAAIRYAARSAHADGSSDDYYPFERATGASAFSLLAMLDACTLTGLSADEEIDAFFRRRAEWLAAHQETGHLSNHEALIVACLVRMQERGLECSENQIRARLTRLLSWQSEEGWFDEYGGADPGYLSLTIGLLADIDRRRPDLQLREPITRAVKFLAAFVHPDGSVGGEYCSRGTVNFFPHGFEIAGQWLPEALAINDRALRPLVNGTAPCFSDDRIVAHHLWSRLLAWTEWNKQRPGPIALPTSTADFPKAGLRIAVHGQQRVYCGSTNGAFKLFHGEELVASDTGPTVQLRDGRVAVARGGVPRDLGTPIDVEGPMTWAKTELLTPFRSIVLRTIMLTVGRFAPNLIRSLLQRRLVTGKSEAPFSVHRTASWCGNGLKVRDEIVPADGWQAVKRIGVGGFQLPITTAMGRVWQPAQLQPWEDWTGRLAELGPNQPLVVERTFSEVQAQQCAA